MLPWGGVVPVQVGFGQAAGLFQYGGGRVRMGLEAVFLRNAQGVYGGDAAGCGGDIGGVVEGTARQVLLQDEGVGKVPRVWVHVAGPRGDARRGEQPEGVVLAGRLHAWAKVLVWHGRIVSGAARAAYWVL